jgi:polar amino acid transport system substrate-binding protein
MRTGFAFVLVCGLCLLGTVARAETVSLTTGQDDPPFTDRSRPDGGIATRLVLAIFHGMGYETQLDWLPWRRGYSLTKTGVYQASFPYLKTPEREHDFIYSDVIFSDASYLWTRAGDSLSTEDLGSFKNKTICVPQGFHSPLLVTLSALIDRGEVKIERADTPEKCVQMLAAGRVDALSGQEAEITLPIKANNLEGSIVHGTVPLMKLDFYVIFNKENAALARRFNQTLRQMKEDGSYAARMAE